MPYKFRRYYRIEIYNGDRNAPTVSGFISEIELSPDEVLRLQSGWQDRRLDIGQDEDIAAIKSTVASFFDTDDITIVEVNMQQYQKLFDAQAMDEAHLPTEMRGDFLCTQKRLM